MELPHIGIHCHESSCNRLDFLPVKCDACLNSFCMDHMSYMQHACPNALSKDVQVPVCPLCNQPVSSPRNQAPDIAVGRHIDQDCQSDPAMKQRKKQTKNRCNATGCKVKEIIPVLCNDCGKNFCLKHRFGQDHQCAGKRGRIADAAEKRVRTGGCSQQSLSSRIQGSMSEDEALARALAESMNTAQRQPVGGNGTSNQRCHVS